MSERDAYILGCNTRWPIVRAGLWIAAIGATLGAVAICAATFLDSSPALFFIAGAQFGLAAGTWAVALNRSKINDIVGVDVWQSHTHQERGER